jgi:RNA polymerase sigma-70 factor (ECF subfamily)
MPNIMVDLDQSHKKDEEIAASVQSGKIDAFGILIQRYEVKISRYARKFLYDADDIKDIIQEIFIKAYINIKSFDIRRKFSSWIYRIAHNELVNALKKKKRRQILPLFDLDVFFPQLYRRNTLHEDAERKEMQKNIEGFIHKLEDKYREPVILYYLEELSYQEISDVMQIPISTVGVRIKRAKSIMQHMIKKDGKPI